MKLKDLIQGLEVVILNDFSLDIEITKVVNHSTKVQKNVIYVGISGYNVDGASFIKEALNKGAYCAVVNQEHQDDEELQHLNCIFVNDTRKFLSMLLDRMYKFPPEKLIAITGTNGKSSISSILEQSLLRLNKSCLRIGTLGVFYNGLFQKNTLTTPDVIELYEYIDEYLKKGVDYIVLEASSQGIEQSRLGKIKFGILCFSNLTQDHLDYHQTMEKYFLAKKKLFDEHLKPSGFIITNIDDDFGAKIATDNKGNIMTYGKKQGAKLLIKDVLYGEKTKIDFVLNSQNISFNTNLVGDFNAYNFAASILVLQVLGFDVESILQFLDSIKTEKGRMEKVATYNGGDIFIDYAHTPNAMDNILKFSKKITKNRLHILFGCGGNRDKSKRIQMGEIATRYADVIYVTDDNPRYEDPKAIRADIMQSCHNCIEIEGRKKAIEIAIKNLQRDDLLIIAGKGHETHQVIGGEKFDFDEKEIIQETIDKINNYVE